MFQKLFTGRIAVPVTTGTQDIRFEILIGTIADRVRLVKKLRSEGLSKRELCALTGLSARMINKYIDMQECDIPEDKQTVRGREHEDAVNKLVERANRVRELRESGLSIDAITHKTGFNQTAVKSYLSASFVPVNGHYGNRREGKLSPFRSDVLQWRADGITYREIYDRIREMGYSGTQDAIRGFISKERRIQRDLKNAVGGDTVELIDKKWLIRLLYKPIEDVRVFHLSSSKRFSITTRLLKTY